MTAVGGNHADLSFIASGGWVTGPGHWATPSQETVYATADAAPAPSAEQRLAEELHELEGISSQVLTVMNQLREKSKSLYTGAQVGDAQVSEAELVSAPLKARIRDLEARWAESMAGDHQTIVEQRQRIAELESLQKQMAPAGILTISDECVSVGRLTRQLDVALSQVSALQRRADQLAASVSDMQGWLDLRDGELASANEQRDTAREQERRVRAAWTTEIERGRDLEADLGRVRESLAQAARTSVEQETTINQLGTSLAEVRELAAAGQRDLDTMADTLAGREDQIRKLREVLNEAKSVSDAGNARIDHLNRELTDTRAERDSERRSKVHYIDRLASVSRHAGSLEVENALKPGNDPADYAATLAEAILEIREVLKG